MTAPARRRTAIARSAATLVVTAGVWWISRPLGPPPLLHPGRLAGWAADRGAGPAVFAGGRLVVAGAGTYLAVLWVVAAIAAGRPDHGRWPGRVVARLPGLRWATSVVVGVALAGLSAAGPAGASGGPGSGAGPAPMLTWLGPTTAGPAEPADSASAPPTTGITAVPPSTTAPSTTHPTGATAVPSSTTTTRPTTARPVTPAPAGPPVRSNPARPRPIPRAVGRPATAGQVVVRPGDCFWSIAAAAVRPPGGAPAPVGEVAAYWHRLIRANADRLPRPGDPDLLFPGDVVVLPPVPPGG